MEGLQRVFDKFFSDPETFSTAEGINKFSYWHECSAFKAQLKANALLLAKVLMGHHVTAFIQGAHSRLGKDSRVCALAGHQEITLIVHNLLVHD
jgi:hypothetical protein